MFALFFVLACASTPDPMPAEPAEPAGVAQTSPGPDSTASQVLIGTLDAAPHFVIRFLGEEVPAGINPDLGIRSLEFSFQDGSAHTFRPTGTLYHSDWSSELRSPDGRWIFLPQDHYGPYHIVAVERVAAYLQGDQPDHVIGQTQASSGSAWVHAGAGWTAESTFSYRAGLTTMEQFDVVVE